MWIGGYGAGSGAQADNRNASKHGFWSAAAEADRRRVAALTEAAERMLEEAAERAG